MSTPLKTPWFWVPTLYLIEGIPYIIVNNISMALFSGMGVPNGQMSLFTSLLYLPWVIKPLWSSLIDSVHTKRWWIITMQIVLTLCFVLLVVTIPHPLASDMANHTSSIHLFLGMLIVFWITAFASATHDIAADGFYMLALNDKEQAFYVGIRSTFYRIATILGQGALIYLVGRLSLKMSLPAAWQIGFGIAALLMGLGTIWHMRFLPKMEQSKESTNGKEQLQALWQPWRTFFQKKGLVLALLFLLFFRLPEALILKLIYPFMLTPYSEGGLNMTLDQIGIIYSTIGIICLTIGGIIGGICVSKVGLHRAFWWMVLAITLPDLAYVYLSIVQPSNLVWITIALSIEQFGYGFGFTAYMLYMIHFSNGEYKTSHYAICTAFMACSMMLPGVFAGYLEEAVGYAPFFLIAMATCLITVAVSIPIRKQLNA